MLLISFALFCCFAPLSLCLLAFFILCTASFSSLLLLFLLLFFSFLHTFNFAYSLAWTNNRCEFQQNNTIKIHHATVDILLCTGTKHVVITNTKITAEPAAAAAGPSCSSNANNFRATNERTNEQPKINYTTIFFVCKMLFTFLHNLGPRKAG